MTKPRKTRKLDLGRLKPVGPLQRAATAGDGQGPRGNDQWQKQDCACVMRGATLQAGERLIALAVNEADVQACERALRRLEIEAPLEVRDLRRLNDVLRGMVRGWMSVKAVRP